MAHTPSRVTILASSVPPPVIIALTVSSASGRSVVDVELDTRKEKKLERIPVSELKSKTGGLIILSSPSHSSLRSFGALWNQWLEIPIFSDHPHGVSADVALLQMSADFGATHLIQGVIKVLTQHFEIALHT